jgi:hypothetical protein
MVKGKNKEQFEKWYMETYKFFVVDLPNSKNGKETTVDINFNSFYRLPFEMQIGVYLAYYDSIDLECIVKSWKQGKQVFLYSVNYLHNSSNYSNELTFNTRPEAYKEAYKEADILINKELDK